MVLGKPNGGFDAIPGPPPKRETLNTSYHRVTKELGLRKYNKKQNNFFTFFKKINRNTPRFKIFFGYICRLYKTLGNFREWKFLGQPKYRFNSFEYKYLHTL